MISTSIKRIFAGLIILAAAGTPADQVWAGQGNPTVIVLFGDSITVGFNSSFGDNFGNGSTVRGCPTIYLTNILLKQDPRSAQESCPTEIHDSPILDANKEVRNVVVANWGEGGTNTARGVNRITANLNQTRNDHAGQEYLTLIMYGTNDPGSGISTATTKFNTIEMIRQARAAGYEPIIGTLTPRNDRDITGYNARIVSAANEEGVFVVDHYARFIAQSGGWTSLIEQEISVLTGKLIRLHPNNHGYLVIAETWFDSRLRNIIDPEARNIIAPVISILLDD